LLLLSGCAGIQQSSVDAAGTQSARIEHLLNFFFILLGAVFVLVIATALWTLTRRHRGIEQEPVEQRHRPSDATESRLRTVTVAATIATLAILFGLLIASVSTGAAVSNFGRNNAALTIELTGNQWWWSARYLSSDPSRILVTANEIHIPVGKPVRIEGTSHDVIHSFWIPNLQGKMDLVPSRVNAQVIEAAFPGRYRGQCAEFCGLQHAHMALWIVAESESDFAKWMDAQLQPAAEPANPDEERGRQVFLGSSCVLCHAIRGTPAAGQNGPDLTHLASRFTIAAGTLPNTKGDLGGWIADPQRIKPGNRMATVALASADLQPLLDYLESLK
jgi:cytochrome c oxidase subunit 2